MTDAHGALADISANSSAYLPLQEASIYKIKHVREAGIVLGLRDEFVIVGENEADDSLFLSLQSIQYELAWERRRRYQPEDVVLKGKVVGANKGGVVAELEGLHGVVPFSQISSVSSLTSPDAISAIDRSKRGGKAVLSVQVMEIATIR